MFEFFKKKAPFGFPKRFRRQSIDMAGAKRLAELPPAEIAAYFRSHPHAAEQLFNESGDKRVSPSTFIEDYSSGYRVGWLSADCNYECEAQFDNLADAATDYLLFSLGKARWTPDNTRVLRDAIKVRGTSVSDDVIQTLAAGAPITVPDMYLLFIRRNSGAAGDLGVKPGYIAFWRAENVLGLNLEYGFRQLAPGFFGFGTDGGEHVFAFDARDPTKSPIVVVSTVPLDPSKAIPLAVNFIDFMRYFGRVSPT